MELEKDDERFGGYLPIRTYRTRRLSDLRESIRASLETRCTRVLVHKNTFSVAKPADASMAVAVLSHHNVPIRVLALLQRSVS